MKIEHIAMYVKDLEKTKTFFETYLNASLFVVCFDGLTHYVCGLRSVLKLPDFLQDFFALVFFLFRLGGAVFVHENGTPDHRKNHTPAYQRQTGAPACGQIRRPNASLKARR